MKYIEARDVILKAWDEFFNELEKAGFDYDQVYEAIDSNVCFKSVFDALISCVEIEEE